MTVGKNPSPDIKCTVILVVDDERTYRKGISDFLMHAGFHPQEASNGNEALRLAREHQPSLIILDVMMPGMSGLDVCRMLKTNSDTRYIKIIMLSARGQEKEKEEGFAAGADRYISKPFTYNELIQSINELIGGGDT